MTEKPTRPAVPEPVTADVRIFMLLLVACVVVYLFSVPVSLAALVLAPLAAFFGIRALVRSRQGERLGGLRVSIALGLGLCAMAMLAGLGQALLFDLIVEQNECRSNALTNAAQRECQENFDQAYQDRLRSWGVSVPSPGASESPEPTDQS